MPGLDNSKLAEATANHFDSPYIYSPPTTATITK